MLEAQARYETDLHRLSEILSTALVPKLAMLQVLQRRMVSPTSNDEYPLLPWIVEALQIDVVLTLTKLLDDSRSDRNVQCFLKFAEGNRSDIKWKDGALSHATLVGHVAALREHESAARMLRAHRDKYFAHSDKEYFLEPTKLDDDFPVTLDEVVGLVRAMQRIIGEHLHGLGEGVPVSLDSFFALSAVQMADAFRPVR